MKDIHELRPAHALTLTRDGLHIWRYWNVESKQHTDSLDETTEQCSFPSNGCCRTTTCIRRTPFYIFVWWLRLQYHHSNCSECYSRVGKGPLHTYSIDYENNSQHFQGNAFQPSQDAPWIQKVADYHHTNHHFSVISQNELAEYLTEAVHVRDLPGMADIDSSLLWFCKEIKQDFTVGLSGECADEIFGGYPWFHTVAESENEFPWIRSQNERNSLLNDSWQKKLHIDDYIQHAYLTSIAETPRLEGESAIDRKRRELFYLNMTWFMTTLLERKDRMSMGASLEVRVPFADHRLVEYVWNIPWEYKMVGNQEKGILRKALQGVLPKDVLQRKKSPYPKTHNPIYSEKIQSMLKEQLKDKNSILHELFHAERLADLIDSNGSAFKATLVRPVDVWTSVISILSSDAYLV